jgi:peptidoglycan/LPS O-acetylase OafA/YrhL
MTDRIRFLDGLRGVAILMVVFYHYYARWLPPTEPVSFYPYGAHLEQTLANFMPFKYGCTGVNLFFLISGYVIFLTLEKCQNSLQFLARRWIRLFPSMLMGSVFLFILANILPHYPFTKSASDLLPGLTFIPPEYWNWLLHEKFIFLKSFQSLKFLHSLDDSFWTLYVEARFYILAAIAHALARRYVLPLLLLLCCLRPLLAFIAPAHAPMIANLLVLDYLPWFCCGMAAYQFQGQAPSERRGVDYSSLIGILLTAAFLTIFVISVLAFCPEKFIILIMFFAPFVIPAFARLFSHPWIVFVGMISYPLYLIHEYIGVGILNVFKNYSFGGWSALEPLPLVALMMLIAWAIFKFIEQPAQLWLKAKLKISKK